MESKLLRLSASTARKHLTSHILPFWLSRMTDTDNGGFYGRIDGYDKLHSDADKGIILNTRILWTFSSAGRILNNDDYQEAAGRAFAYIMDHFLDTRNGGVYWMVDFKGKPTELKKQVYAQAFTLYALSEYYRATSEPEAKKLAIDLFYLVEEHSFDQDLNGYIEALDQEWRPLDDVRLSTKDLNAEKTMNTHLHILEAYTNLFRIWPDDQVKQKIINLLDVFRKYFISETGHFHLFFSKDWSLLSHEVSYGHDIEGSWLIHEAIEVAGLNVEYYNSLIISLLKGALEGMDGDGGLMNEGRDGVVIDSDKHWWPQAEALVGLVNMWQLSGSQKYLELAQHTWSFIVSNIIDNEKGEWYWLVDQHGQVDRTEDKAGPWKCPYHNGRAMLEMIRRLPEQSV